MVENRAMRLRADATSPTEAGSIAAEVKHSVRSSKSDQTAHKARHLVDHPPTFCARMVTQRSFDCVPVGWDNPRVRGEFRPQAGEDHLCPHPFEDPQNVPYDYRGPVAPGSYVDPSLYNGPDARQNLEDYQNDNFRRYQQIQDDARRAHQRRGGGYNPPAVNTAEQERARRESVEKKTAAMTVHRKKVEANKARFGEDRPIQVEIAANQTWIFQNESKYLNRFGPTAGLQGGGLFYGAIFFLISIFFWGSPFGNFLLVAGLGLLAVGFGAMIYSRRIKSEVDRLKERNRMLIKQIGCGNSGCETCHPHIAQARRDNDNYLP